MTSMSRQELPTVCLAQHPPRCPITLPALILQPPCSENHPARDRILGACLGLSSGIRCCRGKSARCLPAGPGQLHHVGWEGQSCSGSAEESVTNAAGVTDAARMHSHSRGEQRPAAAGPRAADAACSPSGRAPL